MRLLFLCTHNACRSILAEAIARHLLSGRLAVASAGSEPAGRIHPLTLQHLQVAGYSIQGLHSKNWDVVQDFTPDLVITLCDQAAGETCPIWFTAAAKVHWGLPDPSRVIGSQDDIEAAFSAVITKLEARLDLLGTHDLESLTKEGLTSLFQTIGKTT